jgi:hypothetical protein
LNSKLWELFHSIIINETVSNASSIHTNILNAMSAASERICDSSFDVEMVKEMIDSFHRILKILTSKYEGVFRPNLDQLFGFAHKILAGFLQFLTTNSSTESTFFVEYLSAVISYLLDAESQQFNRKKVSLVLTFTKLSFHSYLLCLLQKFWNSGPEFGIFFPRNFRRKIFPLSTNISSM